MLLNLLKNNVLKSLLYILFFAGILKLSGMLLTWFWNSYLVYTFDVQHITFLESVGMLAFFYLVYSGVKFGFVTIIGQKNTTDNLSSKNMPQCQQCEKNALNNTHYVNNLTLDEKEKLKAAIAKCCGFQHSSPGIESKPTVSFRNTTKINP